MHTRRRVLAGVTAGSLALGVLALSPITPASAVVDGGATPAKTTPYLVGSVARVKVPTLLEDVTTAAARVVPSGPVAVYGEPFGGTPTPTYGAAAWSDISAATTVGSSAATPDFIALYSPAAVNATVQFWNDLNSNGAIDIIEQGTASLAQSVNFVAASSVSVAVTAPSIAATGTSVSFSAMPMVGTNPLAPTDAAVTTVTGTTWTSGAFASLNGAAGVSSPTVPGAAGTLAITGWFDPTGATASNATAAPSPLPTGFVVGTGSTTIVAQTVSADSSVTAAGTGLVANAGNYASPQSTKNITFEVTALQTNPDPAALPGSTLPIANQPIVIDLSGSGFGSETVSVNGGTAGAPGTVFAADVNAITDASGKATVTLAVTTTDPAAGVTAGAAVTVSLTSISGASVSESTTVTWTAPGTISNATSTIAMIAPAGIAIPAGTAVAISTVTGFAVSVPESVPQNFRVTLKDTLGNPVVGRQVTITGFALAPPLPSWTGVTGADGAANVTIPGSASPNSLIITKVEAAGAQSALFTANLQLGLAIKVDFKTTAQLTASSVTPSAAQTAVPVTIGTNPVTATQVFFDVLDSSVPAPQPMLFAAGLVTASDGAVLYTSDPSIGLGKTLAEGAAISGNVTLPSPPAAVNGRLSMWVASATSGTKTITVSIGGKTASTTVNFVAYGPAASLGILPASGGVVPPEVPSNTTIPMVVEAKDANGNLIQTGTQVLINMIGAATSDSGGKETVLIIGPSGKATFNVVSGAFGSFEVTATTNGFLATGLFIGPGNVTATTGEIMIAQELTIRAGNRTGANLNKVVIRGQAKGFAPGSEVTIKVTRANGEKVSKTVTVSDTQTYRGKVRVGVNPAEARAISGEVKSPKITV